MSKSFITYREHDHLLRHQVEEVDRSEQIEGEYRVVNGALERRDAREDVSRWTEREALALTERIEKAARAAGAVIGAWQEHRLVGFATLDATGVGGDTRTLRLDALYVSSECRGRGIGRALVARIADKARERGGSQLYISATPTCATVDAYLRMGARLLVKPDEKLWAEEPLDIHLVIDISSPLCPRL